MVMNAAATLPLVPPSKQVCDAPLPFDVAAVRSQFPILAERPDTLFLDNASTTQKPQAVIDCFTDFYRQDCANAGRASYAMSSKLVARIEGVRGRVAKLIGAEPNNICFTSGATASLNAVSQSWGAKNLKSGDEIMLCFEDHKSAVLPWLNLQAHLARFGIDIKIVPIRLHQEGDYELASIRESMTERTRLIAISHVHHLYGLDMEVEEIRKIAGDSVLISLDASQSVGHRLVDSAALDVDFISFSGHKMLAGMGVGILYVRRELLGMLQPVTVGGGMPAADMRAFPAQNGTAAMLVESGTRNIPAVLSMEPAIEMIENIGLPAIEKRLLALSRYLYAALREIPGIEFSPGIDRCACRRSFGIVSFRFEQVLTSDLAFVLDSANVLVRTGDHCLSSRREGDDYIRVSLYIYNTEGEIDRLVETLRTALG